MHASFGHEHSIDSSFSTQIAAVKGQHEIIHQVTFYLCINGID